MQIEKLGRFSYLCSDPFDSISLEEITADPLARLQSTLSQFSINKQTQLPPFQGGVAGVFSYELGGCFEKVSPARHQEFDLPLLHVGLYDVVVAWDHLQKQAWIVSQGLPESSPERRQHRAETRAKTFEQLLTASESETEQLTARMNNVTKREHCHTQASAFGLSAPQFETQLGNGWIGNFDSVGIQNAVRKAIDYIVAGDIFQVNLSQRLMRPITCSADVLFRNLCDINPAPFAGYYDLGTHQVISASPERFLQVSDRMVETRPIKGTRKRTGIREVDEKSAQELRTASKDLSENTMIVDLMRNDLSRVCIPESFQVDQLCEVEAYAHVLHLVSSVRARLEHDATLTDLIAATFPGGSITGAPKIRAMEIIQEIEPTTRGPYCGSMGYLGFCGDMDLNILIRTVTASRGWWQFQVGGGIVSDSEPRLEEEEMWNKATGLASAMHRCDLPFRNAAEPETLSPPNADPKQPSPPHSVLGQSTEARIAPLIPVDASVAERTINEAQESQSLSHPPTISIHRGEDS